MHRVHDSRILCCDLHHLLFCCLDHRRTRLHLQDPLPVQGPVLSMEERFSLLILVLELLKTHTCLISVLQGDGEGGRQQLLRHLLLPRVWWRWKERKRHGGALILISQISFRSFWNHGFQHASQKKYNFRWRTPTTTTLLTTKLEQARQPTTIRTMNRKFLSWNR